MILILRDRTSLVWVLGCCIVPHTYLLICLGAYPRSPPRRPPAHAWDHEDPRLPTDVHMSFFSSGVLSADPLHHPTPTQIAGLRREEAAYMDPAYRRRKSARRSGDTSAGGGGGGSGDDDGDGGSGGSGREKTYSDDYNDRACAALLKYKRVAGFVLGAGGGGREAREDGGAGGKLARKVVTEVDVSDVHNAHARVAEPSLSISSPSPEDIVEWLDARLLDKNIPPLYRTGLRPEHAPLVLETLSRGGGGRSVAEAAGVSGRTSSAFGGLGEAVVREIVVGEASRRDGHEGGAGGESGGVEEAPAEVAEAVAAMFGEGKGQVQDQDQPQRGPWQQK